MFKARVRPCLILLIAFSVSYNVPMIICLYYGLQSKDYYSISFYIYIIHWLIVRPILYSALPLLIITTITIILVVKLKVLKSPTNDDYTTASKKQNHTNISSCTYCFCPRCFALASVCVNVLYFEDTQLLRDVFT